MPSPVLSRRILLQSTGLGAASLALQTLLSRESFATGESAPPHHAPLARRVIFLFMAGAPSQVDLLDPKPELSRLAGQDVPESIAQQVPRIKRAGLRNLMASPWKFNTHGESGLPISTLLPATARHADDLCVIRSMTHRNPVHGPGECVALTGDANGERPSLGAWTLYGLGSETDELPEFVAMNLHTSGMQYPQAAGWGAGFLPARLQGTVVQPAQGIRHIAMPQGVDRPRRRQQLEAIKLLDRRFLEAAGEHSELAARIHSYERAFRMQAAAPELFDLGAETAATKSMYCLDDEARGAVGRSCLLARRMVERGVRFVQIRVGGWDAHSNLRGNHEQMCRRTDEPVAALLSDLKRRGLLEDTLVVWGGEFGRTPTMEGRGQGRDHSPAAYSVWLAGGGVRGGAIVGATDPIGYTVTDRPVSPLDLHATVLRCLGIDSRRLVFDRHGLPETPLGVDGGGPVLEALRT